MQGKGGSWKIAYADFVTAMMAFFLVMWLINASNEEIKAQVANYFNPIQLTDSTTGARSIRDTTDVETAKVKDLAKNGQSGEAASKQAGETAILANPPLALDLIESKSAGGMESGAKVGTSDDLTPASNTKKSAPGVGDPFDPKSWEKASPPVPPPGAGSPDKNDGAAEGQPQDAAAQKKSSELSKAEKASGKQAAGTNAEDANLSEGELLKKYGEQAEQISAEIASALGRAVSDLKGSVDVRPTPDGLVVSLTESEKFEMFKAGSAEPGAETIRLVGAVAKTIQDLPGGIYVRGHTDARPYRNNYYDNWQLSTARAHVARYMLVRGGLDDGRILRVEGVADREPLNAENPLAAENRRIEFFIQMKKP